jgi:hypothetical protein
VVKRKIPSTCRDSNLQSSSPYPSAIPLSYLAPFSLVLLYIIHRLIFVNAGAVCFLKGRSENIKVRELGRPRRTWEDNIRMDLKEIWWEGVDWIHLAQDRNPWRGLVNTVKNHCVPRKLENFLTS